MFEVKTAYIFGSCLQDKERLGAIDLAIELEPKESDPEKLYQLCQQCIAEAVRDGVRFSSFLEQAIWSENKVWKKLKSRFPLPELASV